MLVHESTTTHSCERTSKIDTQIKKLMNKVIILVSFAHKEFT